MKSAMTELSKSDKGDDSGAVKLSELFGRHFRGTYYNFLSFEIFGMWNSI